MLNGLHCKLLELIWLALIWFVPYFRLQQFYENKQKQFWFHSMHLHTHQISNDAKNDDYFFCFDVIFFS